MHQEHSLGVKFQNFLGEHAPRPPYMARCRAPLHLIFKTLILLPLKKIFLDETLHRYMHSSVSYIYGLCM